MPQLRWRPSYLVLRLKFNPKVGIVVTSRLKSARLPGKAVRKINGKTLLQILIEALQRQKDYDIVLAIPDSPENDELEQIGKDLGVIVERSSLNSPLHEIHAVIQKYRYEHIVRVTQDDILIDPMLLQNQVRRHLEGPRGMSRDYTYQIKSPEGTGVEVISARAIAAAVKKVGNKRVEHVSYYVRKPDEFDVFEYYPPYEYQHRYRLTIDYKEDLTLVRILFSMLAQPFSTLDILNLLKNRNNKHLLDINRLPEITVYTCCHNQGKYIRDTLDSIKNQSYDNFELIIVDDASTDDTPRIISEWVSEQSQEFRTVIKVHRFKENQGLPVGSNWAVAEARGRYIVRVDSDDVIDQEFLHIMRMYLEENHADGAVFSKYRPVDERGQTLDIKMSAAYHPGCCMLRTSCVREVMYKEGLNHYEGLEFFKRFGERFQYGVIEDVLWNYRQHAESKSAQNTDERQKVLDEISNQRQ